MGIGPAETGRDPMTIYVDWMHGRPSGAENPEQDEMRAIAAAEQILSAFEWRKGGPEQIDHLEAQAAYDRHMGEEEYLRSPRETTLIAAWEAAQRAADLALTEGWDKPGGASCTIRAW